jgi:Fe-S oxidoreductase
MAAVDVLEAAGFAVEVPHAHFCCGRPLYDWGMLKEAQRYLRRILSRFARDIDAGRPFVVLEPACATVFRDEMRNLFPGDEVAKRLANQTFLLGEFLQRKAPHFAPPPLPARALLHGHCHQKAIMGMHADEEVLAKAGVRYRLLDSGCCGMAGSFGFERDKADLSVRIGELVLLPEVRTAPPDCLVIADGYSCREQIAQCTNRHAVHLADVLKMALAGEAPERAAAAVERHAEALDAVH